MDGFNFKEYAGLDLENRASYINNFILDQFALLFNKGEKVDSVFFNKVVSQDRTVRKWFRKLKEELNNLSKLPTHTLIEGAPSCVHGIILSEAEKVRKFNAELEKETQKVVFEYKTKMDLLDEKKKKEYKSYSYYTLVGTITIDDVPLEMKRKIFTETDDDKVTLYRKDVVLEYKRKCFENLVKNNGQFSKDFDNPFEAK